MLLYAGLGWCVWDLPALGVLGILAVAFALHRRRLKKQELELENEIARRNAQQQPLN